MYYMRDAPLCQALVSEALDAPTPCQRGQDSAGFSG